MGGFIEWVKSHPLYDALALVGLFIVIYLFRSLGGSSAGGGVQYVSSGPSDAVTESQIAASAQAAQTQAAATVQAQQLQAQYNATVLQTQQQEQANALAAGVANNQTGASVQEASLAADVANNQTAGQVSISNTAASTQQAITIAGDNSQVDIANLQTSGAVAINGQNQQTQQTQIAASQSTLSEQLATDAQINEQDTGAQVALANTAAGVLNTQTNAAAGVQNGQTAATLRLGLASAGVQNNATAANLQLGLAGIAGTTAIDSQELTSDTSIANAGYAYESGVASEILQGVNSGVYNKGGQGGSNQVSAAATVTGTQNIGVAAQGASSSFAQSNSPGSIISSFSSLFGKIGSGVAAGLGAP